MNVLEETSRSLAEYAQKYKSILVGFSGGKDSTVLTDLCCQRFAEVHLYHLHFVPDLELAHNAIAYARARWNVQVHHLVHPALFDHLRDGIYCFEKASYDDLPKIETLDLVDHLRKQIGVELVAVGHKSTDGLWRAHIISQGYSKFPWLIFPINKWSKKEVMAYLRMKNLQAQDGHNKVSSGINLTTDCVLWLWKHHRGDYEKIRRWFPFVQALVYRYEKYGIPKDRKEAS